MSGATKTRLTAAERSEQVLEAAVKAFAANGYVGTKTDEIARLAGVSQPYVIRLFGTKQQLFLAATQRVCDRIEQAFRAAAGQRADLASLAAGYDALLAERELLAGHDRREIVERLPSLLSQVELQQLQQQEEDNRR